ncbi:hypothetical protein L6164_027791 [Bauhinia variegata]|uniref:Uncharacterized protein n=1 Tax=Bauhinia variegata TaxID=167791 RepID=A0ACB9LUI2_BAUVA|nr:hypothetical protein L6164_027791 [Bauhinia variegata]
MVDLAAAAVGATFGALLKEALEIIKKACKYRSTLEGQIETFQNLGPVIKKIEKFNEQLDRPRQEVEGLIRGMSEMEKLIGKCPKPKASKPWRVFSFPTYYDKLKATDKSFERSVTVDLQLRMAGDLQVVLLKLENILESLSKQSYGTQIQGPHGAPAKPEFTVGLNEPLQNLKIELLKPGVSVHVVTGLGGFGKTTFAKTLCWDDKVKGKFGNNIFFVVVSQTPNLKIIVQTLYEDCGLQRREFHNDEEAINKLGNLLIEIGKSPILLVLDDVWPGSESLIEKFKCSIPDYKILVTSRVAFVGFDTISPLKPLGHEDAEKLFCHLANVEGSNLVSEIVRSCKGIPLSLKVIGRSLRGQDAEAWQEMKKLLQGHSILESLQSCSIPNSDPNTDLFACLKSSLDLLEHKSPFEFSVPFPLKECFKDLGLFPEDQRIPVAALIDMWTELYELDDCGTRAMLIVKKLANSNLADVLVTKNGDANNSDEYKCYNYHFVMQHDIVRELAICLSKEGPFEERDRLIIDEIKRPHWWIVENPQGITARILSSFPKWLIGQRQQRVVARTMSISTGENFTSDWCSMQADKTEVLVLNIRSKTYTFPEFMKNMSKLRVLIVTNYGFHPSEINNFELLSFLSNLKRIRLEKVSVPCLCRLNNLKKLSFYMCNTSQAFDSCSIEISSALPKLEEMNIDYCIDLEKLPAGICKITSLKKLSITNCHKFKVVPQEIGELENLEELRLSCCSDLEEMRDSIGNLHNLRLFDITDCISLTNLPEKLGELRNLEKLCMKGCSRCELPDSVENLQQLNCVVCDEDTSPNWEPFKAMLPKLEVKVLKADINLHWLPGVLKR